MVAGQVSVKDEEQKKREQESWDDMKVMITIMGVMVLGISVVLVRTLSNLEYMRILNYRQFFIAWMLGARFDLAIEELRKGNFKPPKKIAHSEL